MHASLWYKSSLDQKTAISMAKCGVTQPAGQLARAGEHRGVLDQSYVWAHVSHCLQVFE